MTTPSFKDEYQEYMPESDEPSATWEAALRARQYLAQSNDPTRLPKMYEQGRVPRDVGGTGRVRARRDQSPANTRKFGRHPYVDEVEKAWAATRGETDLTLLLAADQNDLALMGADPDLLKTLETRQRWMAMEREHVRNLNAVVDQQVADLERVRGFQRNMALGLGGDAGPAGVTEQERQELLEKEKDLANLNFSDALEEEFTEWEEAYRKEWQTRLEAQAESKAAMGERHLTPEEIQSEVNTRVEQRRVEMFSELSQGARYGDVFGTDSALQNNMESVGAMFGLVAKGAEFLLDQPGPRQAVYQYLQLLSSQRKGELIAEQKAAMGLPDEELFRNAAAPLLRAEWDKMAAEGGEGYQEYMKIAGFDPLIGFSLFAADVEEQQMEGFLDDLRSADLDHLVMLQESDFRVSDTLLEGLAWYGHQVSFLPTALTYLVTDQDKWDNTTTDAWINYLKEIPKEVERLDRVPSRAAGIEGSVAGLALDLVGPGILDPVVMLTGPRGSVRTLKPSTFAEAANMAKSPMMKHMMRDALDAARSPSRGAGALQHQIGWMDEVARAEFLSSAGWTPQVFPASPWRLTKGAEAAMEVETSFLRKFAPAVTDDVSKLADDLTKHGFKEYGEVQISRLTGEMRLTDGGKRLAALETIENATRMPVTFKLVDNFVEEISDPRWERLARGQTAHEATGGTIPPESLTNRIAAGRRKGWEVKQVGEVDGMPAYEMNGIYWVESPTGEFVTGIYAHGARQNAFKGGLAVSADATKGQGFFYKLVKIVEESDPDVILRLAADPSLSTEMYDWMVRYAKTKLTPAGTKTAAITSDDLAQAAARGLSEADILELRGQLPTKLSDVLGDSQPLRPMAEFGAGEVTVRPDLFLPRDVLMGAEDAAAMERIMAEAAGRGNVPDMASRTVLQRAWNTHFREALRVNGPGRWIERYMGQMPTVRRLELVGPGSMERIYDAVFRIWGDDTAKLNQWTEAIMDFERRAAVANKQAVQHSAALQAMRRELTAIEDLKGGIWDDMLRRDQELINTGAMPEEFIPNALQARRNRAQTQRFYTERLEKFEEAYALSEKARLSLPTTDELGKLIEDMYDDFNRTYIAPNPAWAGAKRTPEGLVDWDALNKGVKRPAVKEPVEKGMKQFFPDETMQTLAAEVGVDPEIFMQTFSNSLNTKMAVYLPVSPMELVMAREVGGALYTRASHTFIGAQIREGAFTFQKLWNMDKVFRLSTAQNVSFDELLRIWGKAGMESFPRWLQMRADFLAARAQAALHGEKFWHEGVARGAKYLSPKAQERIRSLYDFPTYLKQAERQFYDGNGLGWTDVFPDDPHYYETARRWTGDILQDTGFRAMLKGREAFREWFFGPDGQRLRDATAIEKTATGSLASRALKGADEAYEGWKTVFEDVILAGHKKAGTFDAALKAFQDIADRITNAGGRAHELPDFVFEHLGPVRGVQKQMDMKFGVSNLTEKFFDNMFMNPVNVRRGFLTNLTREFERARIEGLLASQGKRIVSDLELERILDLRGIATGNRIGLQPIIQEMALKQNIVTTSMIDGMVERAVMKELDDLLFTWDRGSRFGSQMRAVFPFGRPWADMIGHWGRETLRKPTLRGWVNESNFMGLRSLNERGLIPFNPKPAAMISRLANTDFTIDQGWYGEREGGLWKGSTRTDLSPIFFLPTGGDNVFGVALPGLGYVPLQLMDMVLDRMVDPVEDPARYEELLAQISDFVPTFGYQQGGFISRMVGGGTAATAAGAAVDVLALAQDATSPETSSYFGFTSAIGDITREINRTRHISALLADPEELELLMSATTEEEVELLLTALATEADKRASGQHLTQSVMRWLLPMTNRYDSSIGEILDVWIDASDNFPELQVRPSLRNADLNDEGLARQFANDVRGSYFDLPDWKRDLLIAQQPSLAVNLVSSWEWTEGAEAANLPGTDKSYGTEGNLPGLARHQYYIDQNYIRPLQPIERARRILGTIFSAKEKAAKAIYEFTAQQVNEDIWEYDVSEGTKIYMQEIADSEFGKKWDLRTGREVWDEWQSSAKITQEFYEWFARVEGIPTEGEEFDELKADLRIKTNEQRWGVTWPGLDPDEVTDQFSDTTFSSFTPEVAELAKGLGIPLTPGMSGEQLYNAVQGVLTNVESPLAASVKLSYDDYIGSKSQPARTAKAELAKASHNQELSPEWRQSMTEFIAFADKIRERRAREVGGIPLHEQETVVEKYRNLMFTSDLPLPWEKLWRDAYAKTYGPLDWVAPEPLTPFDPEGKKRTGTTEPLIKGILDGDTIVFKEERNGPDFQVRLLGVRAADFGSDTEGALRDKARLNAALMDAVENGDRIYLVRDPKTFGTSTDHYGRMLAWLWIGDEPFYFPADFRRNQDPSGER